MNRASFLQLGACMGHCLHWWGCLLFPSINQTSIMSMSFTGLIWRDMRTKYTVMLSSHQRQDCLVLSCQCQRCELNWRQVKTVGDGKFQNWTCLVSLQFCPVLKRGTRQNCSVSNILWNTKNCLILSAVQFTLPPYVHVGDVN